MSGPAPAATVQGRITGIDACWGVALIGMMAIHVLPSYDENFKPTAVWLIAAGTSSALFSFAAGVSLSLGYTRVSAATARDRKADRASLGVRAAAIAGVGLVLGQVEVSVSILLTYLGVAFALAIPMLGLGVRTLAACSIGFATFGAVLSQLLAGPMPGLGAYDPSMNLLFSDPGGTLSTLLFTGPFPAIPLMAYLCAGMAMGKLDLRSLDIQLRIFLTGLFLSVGTALTAMLLLGPLGVKEILVEASSDLYSEEEVSDVLTWGPVDEVPLSSGWWQVALSPYSHTAFELLNTLGVAMAAFGVMLFLCDRIHWVVAPLCAFGSMPLTLYSAHILFLATGIWADYPAISLAVQIGAGLLFAVLWRRVSGLQRGPLEYVVAMLAARAALRARGEVRESP